MVDTFIANATVEEYVLIPFSSLFLDIKFIWVSCRNSLRSITRNLLATGPPGVAVAFSNAARSRLRQTSMKSLPPPYTLFRKESRGSLASPSPQLQDALARARSMYGAGLGFSALSLLALIVRATIGLRWEEDGDMADILTIIDADIGQAIQVSLNQFYSLRSKRPCRRAQKKRWKEGECMISPQRAKCAIHCGGLYRTAWLM